MLERLKGFLDREEIKAGRIDNERALQLEIGMMFRQMSFNVQFEMSCRALPVDPEHTKPQKRDLDISVSDGTESLEIELKAPFSGRVPETMYDFYSDVAFVEAIIREGIANRGVCLMLTSDSAFWSGRDTTGIYEPLRVPGSVLHGVIGKPTGKRDNAIVVTGTYRPAWRNLGNRAFLRGGRYTLLEACNADQSHNPTE